MPRASQHDRRRRTRTAALRALPALPALTAFLALALPAARASSQEKPKGPVRVVGRVVSVLYEGVPAAEVWASDASGAQLARTVADGDGWFQLGRLPDVPLRVWARAATMVERGIDVTGAGAVRAAMLVLEDGEALRGRVVLADQSPAAGAAVMVTVAAWESMPDWSAETTTDARGEWTLPCAPLRRLRVSAFVAGKPFAWTEIAGRGDEVVRTVIPAGEPMSRRVVLKGGPAGQRVRVWCDLGGDDKRRWYAVPRAAIEAWTDADGVATLWDLPWPFLLRVAAPDHASTPARVMCRPGLGREVEFTLSPLPPGAAGQCTRMTGTLVDSQNQPIAGARVVGQRDDTRGEPATTAADGTFALDVPVHEHLFCKVGLLAGDWCLGDSPALLGRDGARWVTIEADPRTPLRLRAGRAGAVRGTLLGPTGTPFAAASVQLLVTCSDRVVDSATNAGGVLDVVGLPPGRYRIAASVLDLVGTGTVDVVAGGVAEPSALQFERLGELRGVVTDRDGRPLASAAFELVAAKREEQVRRASAVPPPLQNHVLHRTDQHGNFRVPFVPEGDWVVTLVPPIGESRGPGGSSPPVTVAGGKVAEVEFREKR